MNTATEPTTTLPALPANLQTLATRLVEVAQETSSEFQKLLKFTKGHYYIGDDEVAIGREYIAHVHQLMRGWIKFEDNKPADKKLGKGADGFKVPDREELGDTDQTHWLRDDLGIPRDPWVRQSLLPLEDAETGELVVFVTSSHGGTSAIGQLCHVAGRNVKNGLPKIRLA